MNTEVLLKHLTKQDASYLDELEPLFYNYYKSMEDKGLILKIVNDGGKLWRKSIENALGKTQNVIIAIMNGTVAGFIWGYIILHPAFLGCKIAGVWCGIYLIPEFRSLGISKMMYLELENWFIGKNVHSVEGVVLPANTHSIRGIKRMGFQDELIHVRKLMMKEG